MCPLFILTSELSRKLNSVLRLLNSAQPESNSACQRSNNVHENGCTFLSRLFIVLSSRYLIKRKKWVKSYSSVDGFTHYFLFVFMLYLISKVFINDSNSIAISLNDCVAL